MDALIVKIGKKHYFELLEIAGMTYMNCGVLGIRRIITQHAIKEGIMLPIEITDEMRKAGYVHFVNMRGKELSEGERWNLYKVIKDLDGDEYLYRMKYEGEGENGNDSY